MSRVFRKAGKLNNGMNRVPKAGAVGHHAGSKVPPEKRKAKRRKARKAGKR